MYYKNKNKLTGTLCKYYKNISDILQNDNILNKTSITINGKTSEEITVATEGDDQTKKLTVAYGNGTSQADSTYYVLVRDVYFILSIS